MDIQNHRLMLVQTVNLESTALFQRSFPINSFTLLDSEILAHDYQKNTISELKKSLEYSFKDLIQTLADLRIPIQHTGTLHDKFRRR